MFANLYWLSLPPPPKKCIWEAQMFTEKRRFLQEAAENRKNLQIGVCPPTRCPIQFEIEKKKNIWRVTRNIPLMFKLALWLESSPKAKTQILKWLSGSRWKWLKSYSQVTQKLFLLIVFATIESLLSNFWVTFTETPKVTFESLFRVFEFFRVTKFAAAAAQIPHWHFLKIFLDQLLKQKLEISFTMRISSLQFLPRQDSCGTDIVYKHPFLTRLTGQSLGGGGISLIFGREGPLKLRTLLKVLTP